MSSSDSETAAARARTAMIDSQLRPQGISDPVLLAAFADIDRGSFAPGAATALVYSDRAVPTGNGHSLMAPAALASLIQALEPVSGERALVIGSATGYAAAILERLGIQAASASDADAADVEEPVDIVLFDGAIERVPDPIVSRLAEGGRLAAAIGQGAVSRLVVGTKTGGGFGLRAIGDASVPPLPGFATPREFAF